jgi:DNA-binding cell septation regulator SpoVG
MSTATKTAAVEVVSIKHVRKGSLQAFATVKIADKLTIHSLRIIQQDGQDAWVSMPQTEVPARDGGKPRYFPIVEINDESLKKQITEAVLRSWTPPASTPICDEDVPF